MEERLTLTVDEAAQALGISRVLAYELIARGEIPSLRLGGRIVIPRRALELLLAREARDGVTVVWIDADADAAELRRAVGPVPWFVLEELLLWPGEEVEGAFVVRASARSLAASTSLNKDTVARALAALRRAGLVTPMRQANERGRFGTGAYRIDVVAGVRRMTAPRPLTSAPSSDRHPRRPPPQPAHEPTQLALLCPTVAGDLPDGTRHARQREKQPDGLAPSVPPRPPGRQRDAGTATTAPEAGRC